MSELWGVPNKWATSIDGSDELNMAQTQAQIQHLGALTSQTQVQTQKEKLSLQEEQTAAAVMQKRAQGAANDGGPPRDPLDEMQQYADDLANAGATNKSLAISKKVADIREKQVITAARKTTEKLASMKAEAAMHQDLAETLAAAHDQDSWDIAKMQWQAKYPNQPIPPNLQQYNPAVFDVLRDSTKTGAKLKEQEHKDAVQESTDSYREAQLKLRAQELADRNARAAASRAQRERFFTERQKAGGDKIPRTATNSEVQSAVSLLKRGGVNLDPDMVLGKEPVPSAAFDMAEEAKALMTTNRGLSYPEALNRAFLKMKEDGSFSETVKAPESILGFDVPGTGGDKKTEYQGRAPGSVSSPLPLPPKGTPLVDGKHYQKDGQVFRWDAKRGGGVPVTKRSTSIPLSSGDSSDDSEDGDGE